MIDRTAPLWRRDWIIGKAEANALAADCVRRKVGAIIYDPDTWHTLGEGYNGRPPGLPGCLTAGACPRGRASHELVPSYSAGNSTYVVPGAGFCDAIHAEDNALRRARKFGINVAGAHIGITAEPCDGCYALLRHFDLAFAHWPGGERWLNPPGGLSHPKV